jgi:hypothetical protein
MGKPAVYARKPGVIDHSHMLDTPFMHPKASQIDVTRA